MTRFCLIALMSLLLSGVQGPVALTTAETVPAQAVRTGERLTYEISWLNILAGMAVMEVMADGAAGDSTHAKFVTTAQSRPAITKFFPVDNRVESEFDLRTQLPQHMVFKRREGKNKEDFEYTFHHQDGTVTAVKDGTTEILPIPAGTQDLISCLYYVRNQLPMKPGASLMMNIHHDKKNRQIEVRVEKIEMLEGIWGRAETAQVLVVMPFKGIFINKGNIRVWFTTDERRIPVRMKAKVIIGAIVADLVGGFSTVGAPN
jgi:Protein of unknown function (DUF3108)